MPKRVSQFWFLAFVTLLLSMVCLAVFQIFGPNPWLTPVSRGWRFVAPAVLVYIPWLFTLPFIGALGAYISNRAGGRASAVFSATIFPILPYTVFFIIGLPIAMILDDHVARNLTIPMFFVGLCAWVIFPGAALLAGGVPAHFFRSVRHTPDFQRLTLLRYSAAKSSRFLRPVQINWLSSKPTHIDRPIKAAVIAVAQVISNYKELLRWYL